MDFEEYTFNNDILSIKRPVGVSGLMRVKNEERFVALSIDSCIEALDELIIVYQKSEDKTAEIIKQKNKEYPDKIKVFFYEPEIKSHKLSYKEFQSQKELPFNSCKLLSNYYNYTLSKATYKYALKIDADQIYNTVKLKEICDLYRSDKHIKISLKEKLTGYLFHLLTVISYNLSARLKIFLPNILPSSLYPVYNRYALKKIQNDKITANISGLNLFLENNKPYLLLGDYEDNSFPPFNGIYDHLIFEINQKTFYLPAFLESAHSKYGYCVIERFNLDKFLFYPKSLSHKVVNLGFLWYHVAPLNYVNLKSDKKMPFYIYKKDNLNYNKDIAKKLSNHLFHRMRIWFMVYWKNWYNQPDTYKVNWEKQLKKIMKIYEDK